MNPQRHNLTQALRQPTWPRRGSSTITLPQKSTTTTPTTLSTTHKLWDNPGCLSPQTPSEVSGFRPVDRLDKDTERCDSMWSHTIRELRPV